MLLQWAQILSTEVDGDDDEPVALADLGNDFAERTFEGGASDDVLGFAGVAVALALDDLPREDDAFEVENAEVFIFEFIGGV